MQRLKNLLLPFIFILIWSCIFVPAGFASQSSAASNKTFVAADDQHVTNQIIIRFKASASPNQRQIANTTIISQIRKLNISLVEVPVGQLDSILSDLQINPDVLYAEPNYLVNAQDTIPNDPDWENQYNLKAIHAPQGWDLDRGSSFSTIAIIDSGLDLTHPDLMSKLVAGYDFVDNDDIAQDEYGHGTHVAGIAAAVSNNAQGIAGVSWGAKLMPVRVINEYGSGTALNVANGIIWAVDHSAQVINLSLGGQNPSKAMKDAVDYAITKGVIVVAATGNYGSNSILYPARFDGVIAVGATDEFNNHADFSNTGAEIDLVAPGVNIYSLGIGNNYFYDTGTSMSTPHVAGLAAILVGLPGNSSALVESQMKNSALDLGKQGWDSQYGSGLIQIDVAILLARSLTPTPSSQATPTFTPTPSSINIPTVTVTNTPSPLPAKKLPETGFAHEIQQLPPQTDDKAYIGYSDLLLKIPSISVSLPIVGVPTSANQGWDLTWLGAQAGWLAGSAFPTWTGNSVLTGHVWNADNSPGPFYYLKNLQYADQVNIQAWGQIYTYQVRTNQLVYPDNGSVFFEHEDHAWLTLVTCENYDPVQKKYLYRRIVRAILTNINSQPTKWINLHHE